MVKLNQRAKTLLAVLKEHLKLTESEILEEALILMVQEYQRQDRIPEINIPKHPSPLMEVMEEHGLLD